MPKKYIYKGKGKYQTYDPSKVENAVNDVSSGALSIRKAAGKYGIPKSTISDLKVKKYSNPGQMGRPPALPADVEESIVSTVKEASRQGMGISRRQLLVRVGSLCKKMQATPFKNKVPSKDWWDGLRKRHPELTIRKPEKLATTRARMLNPEVIKKYMNDLGKILEEKNLKDKPHLIWNCDETATSDTDSVLVPTTGSPSSARDIPHDSLLGSTTEQGPQHTFPSDRLGSVLVPTNELVIPLSTSSISGVVPNEDPYHIDDPELLLELLNSGHAEVTTANENGEAFFPSVFNTSSAATVPSNINLESEVSAAAPSSSTNCTPWNSAILGTFLPPKTELSRDKTTGIVNRKKNAAHRLLTGGDILAEKRELTQKREEKEKKQQARKEKKVKK